MKRFLIFILVLFSFTFLSAQNNIVIYFSASLNNEPLLLNKNETLETNETKVSKLKFYVSEIKFLNKKEEVYSEKDSYHLIDFDNQESLHLNIKIKKKLNYDEVSFVLGIDSTTNHSGVQGEDLDPTKGMYWAWQSGYINFKIEGQSDLCKSKTNEFALHLGGFLNGNRCDEKITLFTNSEKQLNINLDLKAFFLAIDLKKQNHIMSPGKEAVFVSKELLKCFSLIKNEE